MKEKPWSHNLPVWGRYVVTFVSAILCGLIGTFAHRVGAAINMPIGLVVAFLLILISTWCARSRTGILGLLLHVICSSAVVWIMALRIIGNDVLVPVGFYAQLPWLSQNAGRIWIYGVVVLPLLMIFLPSKFFSMAKKDTNRLS